MTDVEIAASRDSSGGGDASRRRRGISRAELLGAALRVIRRDGERTAMESIAAEAGVTRPILYRHFGDVSGLYAVIAQHYADDLLAAMTRAGEGLEPGQALVRAQVDSYLAFLEADPNLYRFLTRQFPADRSGGQATVRGFIDTLSGELSRFLEGLGLPAVRAATAGRAFVGTLQATGEWWLESTGVDRAVVAREVADFLWGGFATLGPDRRPGQARGSARR